MIRSIRAGGRRVEYTLVCARNRTSFLLQALPQNKIKLYAPAGCSLREADALVKQNIDKIDRAHSAMDASARALASTLYYGGRPLKINVSAARSSRIILREDALDVLTPYSDPEEINAQIKRWLIKSALIKIRSYLDKWSPTVGIPYGRVTIREQRTRWGSCSNKRNLNFNWKLVMAPEAAMEYVVVHELCHLIHLNHSDRFWAEVRRRMPDYEVWKKWLKRNGQALQFP